MKTCSKCKISKTNLEFRSEKRAKDKLYSWCRECEREKQRERRKNPEYLKEEQRRARTRKYNTSKWLLELARKRAQLKNRKFDLEESDIVIPKLCPILEIPIYPNEGCAGDNSPSLDRKDQTKGYVKGNVWVISRKANAMKAHATIEELKLFCKNITKWIAHDKSSELLES